ncbi:sensor domain-containing diguanylate cyclase [Pseudobowmanella zhangzhouensis]|uniref:diguanylate cyclase n=1 Tax=Pseudobowmanella zhangzhouensis TaxID=1537679 RepID=A0ABW1XPT5_9ALTE
MPRLARYLTGIVPTQLSLLVLWIAVWELAGLMEYANHASVWYPPSALSIAAFLLLGQRAILPITLAIVAVTFQTATQYALPHTTLQLIEAGLLNAAAHILPYWLTGFVIRYQRIRYEHHFTLVILTVLVITPLMTLAATGLTMLSLWFTDMLPFSDIADTWLPFWIGDLTGALALGPMFLGVISAVTSSSLHLLDDPVLRPQQLMSWHFSFRILISVSCILAAMLLASFFNNSHAVFAIFFLVIPHMWIAITEPPFSNATSVAIASLLIAILIPALGLMEHALVYQFAICVVAANSLFGLAIPTLLQHNRDLRQIVATDSLTGVASRERLVRKAMAQLNRTKVQGIPLSAVVFDIDHFKQINDQLGHSEGDKALQQVTIAAQLCLRPCDLLGRFGGDEFVAILPGANQSQAEEISERIRSRVTQLMTSGGGHLSASFGVAQSVTDDTFNSLFERADSALYRAKQAGRNQVMLAPVPEQIIS